MQPTDQPDADCPAPQSPANDDLEQPGSLRELLRVSLPLMISSGSLSLMHIVAALEAREPTGTIFSRYTIANRRFVQLIGAALVLTFLVTTLSPLQRIFDTVSLTSSQWGICLLGPLVFLAVAELGKLLDRRTADDAPVAVAAGV